MKMTKDNCSGCEDNFYNGNNPYRVEECWHFKSAKVIKKKKVHIDQTPPWTQKPKNYPNCYRQKRYVFIDCEKEDRQY
uniref:Uncharacterized protein n=1 Tax=viral metagenome TaxID=1070528 RepID=A0A6M3X9L9_9ZZZZ